MRLMLAIFAVAALAPPAKADPERPVRVIEITRQNADRSAQIIASSKSAMIGMPPAGRVVRTASDWRAAHAELSEGKSKTAARNDSPKIVRLDDLNPPLAPDEAVGRARVQIIKPGKAGMIVETYYVPKQ